MDEQIKSNRAEIKEEEAERRAQHYRMEISEHERAILMGPLANLKGHERTKPERALLKALRELEPIKGRRKGRKKQTPTNGKVKSRRLPGAMVSKPAPPTPKPGKLGKGRKYD